MIRIMSIALVACICATAWAGPVTPPEDFPESPPMAPPLEPPSLPPTFSQKLANGMEVVVVSNDEIPWVSTSWYLLAGAKYDPPEKDGTAAATADLLRQGTEKHTGNDQWRQKQRVSGIPCNRRGDIPVLADSNRAECQQEIVENQSTQKESNQPYRYARLDAEGEVQESQVDDSCKGEQNFEHQFKDVGCRSSQNSPITAKVAVLGGY